MSASPLSPLPSITPRTPTSSPLPAGSRWGAAPFPEAGERLPVGKIVLPSWPEPAFASIPRQIPASPSFTIIPAAASTPATVKPSIAVFQPVPSEPVPVPVPTSFPDPIEPPVSSWVPTPEIAPEPAPIPTPEPPPFTAVKDPFSPPQPDFTDDDLREALAPLFKDFASATPDHQLEPMLRATIRRALAEYSPNGRPFRNPSTTDRFLWRMQALFTSRTYEDILFEKTHRFQVEEVFLVDADSLALVSYASSNPGRHASAKRIETTVKRLAHQARNAAGRLVPMFKLPDGRHVFCHQGHYITLLTVIRGIPNEMALNDLTYTLDTIENRFRERFHIPGSPLLKILQPYLEDCLLIQSPASAA